MKIRPLTPENYLKVSALLKQAFPRSNYEVEVVERLHKNKKPLHEWVCIHKNRITGYIAFSNAYKGDEVCGLHLSLLAVSPEFQNQGTGSELLQFALRQAVIKEETVFVSGDSGFFKKFGFDSCSNPVSFFEEKKGDFLAIRNNPEGSYTVGFEPEF